MSYKPNTALYYHSSSRHRSQSKGGYDAFVVVLLLAAIVHTHGISFITLTWFSDYVLCVMISIVALFCVLKILRWSHKRRSLATSDLTTIDRMSGLKFEQYIAMLLEARGYGAIRLTEEFDYGVDIIAVKDGITWGIQVKRYTGLVGADAVRQAVTALRFYGCDRAMVITNSVFSLPAIKLAESNNCVLIDGSRLQQMAIVGKKNSCMTF